MHTCLYKALLHTLCVPIHTAHSVILVHAALEMYVQRLSYVTYQSDTSTLSADVCMSIYTCKTNLSQDLLLQVCGKGHLLYKDFCRMQVNTSIVSG